ncbi:hypothetical protein [Oscillibacter ruminantium]|uniref:hypothetical protein n=1 Tax=Oscillibacter ruminantium TaxID=1263547 RepID=UPI000591083E|nr:hypothetical protein [Oscillibacter ruminantium]
MLKNLLTLQRVILAIIILGAIITIGTINPYYLWETAPAIIILVVKLLLIATVIYATVKIRQKNHSKNKP